MTDTINFIFDFDSTLVKNESLNDILSLALGDHKEKIAEVDKITKTAMEGLITPQESMTKRLKLATINRDLVNKITEQTKSEITDGIVELISTLKHYDNTEIFIVSGGFREMIIPTAKILGISEKNVYANDFVYKNDIVEKANENLLLQEQGKVKLINKLKSDGILKGKNVMIGDGFTDLETLLYGAVDSHICFAGVVSRKNVVEKSENIAKNIEELKAQCISFIEENTTNLLKLIS